MVSSYDSRLHVERMLAASAAKDSLSSEDYAEWLACGFTFRPLVSYGRIFVVWKHTTLGPVILNSLTVVGTDLDPQTGMSVRLEDRNGKSQWVKHSASKFFGLPVYAHVPFLSEVSYLPPGADQSELQLRLPVVFKTLGNPKFLTDGLTYVTHIGEFRSTYPQFQNIKL